MEVVKLLINPTINAFLILGKTISLITWNFPAPKSLPASSRLTFICDNAALAVLVVNGICLNTQLIITIAAVPVISNGGLLKANIYPIPKNVPGIIYGSVLIKSNI